MQQEDAIDFFKLVTEGTDLSKSITLEHSTGKTLDDVQMHPVDKQVLASVISRLPDEMFDAVDGAEDAEEAEEELEENSGLSMSAINEETVDAFEDLCKNSLTHETLAPPQMKTIVEALNFGTLFELGTEIINMSMENDGAIRDFHERE